MKEMKALRLQEVGKLEVQTVPLRELKDDEILVKVGACGICGSDIPRAFISGAHKMPLTIGHEFSGEVVAVAAEKDNDLIGRKCAVFPLIPCGHCDSCQTGHFAQCRSYDYLGSRCDGGFAEYCIIPSRWQLVLSDGGASYEELCMIEPATVAQHAVRRSRLSGGENIVIIGAGPIGMLAARWAEIFGARNILLSEINADKINFSRELGFKTYNSVSEIQQKVSEVTKGRGADVIIEGTGTGAGLNAAIEMANMFGRVVMMGNPSRDTTISKAMHSQILRKELTLQGVWNSIYAEPLNEWIYTAEMLDAGKLKTADLITHKATLDQLPELFQGIYDRSITICKAIYKA